MGTSWGQIVKEESKRSPGIADYTKCQSGVFAYSTLAMVAVSGMTYGILQIKLFKTIKPQTKILTSIGLGSASTWYIAAVRTKFCQELWMVLDNKKSLPPSQ